MTIKEFQPMVRYAGEVVVFFRDKHTVIVKQGSTMVAFHRWYDRRQFDYTNSWKPFCYALRNNMKLDLSECRRLAMKYGISVQSYSGGLSIPDNIKVIKNGRRAESKY